MTKTPCINTRIRQGDRTLITLLGQDITYNEVHAIGICGAIGLILGERGLVIRTLLAEPWYALVAFAAMYTIGKNIYR